MAKNKNIPSRLIRNIADEKSFSLNLYDVAFLQFLKVFVTHHWYCYLVERYMVLFYIMTWIQTQAMGNSPLYFAR